MNTHANTVSEFPGDTGAVTPAPMSEPRPLYWSVRRELWENRFLYIAPLIVTAFVLFGTFISVIGLPRRIQRVSPQDTVKRHAVVVTPFEMAPAPIMMCTILVGFFYALDALYGERRDRSILFWKSLPVSDRTTVLSKAAIPIVVLPLIALALGMATQFILLFFGTLRLGASSVGAATLWREFRFFQSPLIMIYGVTAHALWFAPIHGWFLLVSAWAKRAPFLWAVLPLLAVSALEKMASNTTYFMYMLQYRVTGAMKEGFAVSPTGSRHGLIDELADLDPARFLSAPGLWVGLIFAAACIAAAVRLRRNREPI